MPTERNWTELKDVQFSFFFYELNWTKKLSSIQGSVQLNWPFQKVQFSSGFQKIKIFESSVQVKKLNCTKKFSSVQFSWHFKKFSSVQLGKFYQKFCSVQFGSVGISPTPDAAYLWVVLFRSYSMSRRALRFFCMVT